MPEGLFLCTEGGNRTHTVLLPLDFESSASTNSATSAYQNAKVRVFININKPFSL